VELIPRLATAGVPAVVIHGAADRLVPLRNSVALLAAWEAAAGGGAGAAAADTAAPARVPQLVVMDGVGHVPQEEAAVRWARHVDAFLDGIRVGG